jgi:hypothetical protein
LRFDWFRQVEPEEDASARAIIDRVQRERGAIDRPPIPDPHSAPTWSLTVDQAHYYMQTHRTCHAKDCDRKAAAWRVLVEAGRIKPDTGRNY